MPLSYVFSLPNVLLCSFKQQIVTAHHQFTQFARDITGRLCLCEGDRIFTGVLSTPSNSDATGWAYLFYILVSIGMSSPTKPKIDRGRALEAVQEEIVTGISKMTDGLANMNLNVPTAEVDQIDEDEAMSNMDELKQHAIRFTGNQHPSPSLLKRVAKQLGIHQCACCVSAFANFRELRNHIKSEEHFYGQERLRTDKENLISRVQVLMPEVTEWAHIHSRYETLPRHLRTTYDNILWIQLLLVRLRSRAG